MQLQLNPYVSFRDNAREAMEFYKSVFGGTLELHTFGEFHAAQDPSEENLIMHSVLKGDNGITFMASDTPKRMEFKPDSRISMSLSGGDDTLLSGYFEKLSAGGQVIMPLEKAQWGDKFGMVTDQYGITWMANVSGANATV
jgi:PhnB protein